MATGRLMPAAIFQHLLKAESLQKFDKSGRESLQIIKMMLDSIVDLLVVGLPVHLDELVSKASHFLQAKGEVGGDETGFLEQTEAMRVLLGDLSEMFG